MSAFAEERISTLNYVSDVASAKSKYRSEIDGLRAFAVVSVIINHFNKEILPSGYLGVDIFFVISGYVITSSLAGRKSKNFLDFLTGFYQRRIKRLVPALVVFILITSVLISLFKPNSSGVLQVGANALFGLSNISLFKASSDYFAQTAELNPFLHTWSLGVEEQFYFLFPFLIWFSGFARQAKNGTRNLFLWIGVLTVASLIGFIYLYPTNQPAAYFLMPPRFWEMAAGCLVFIGFQKRAKIEQALEHVPPLLVVATMVGVMFLPIAAAVPATISIVLLSAVLIACLKSGTAAFTAFTNEKVVYIGVISYSLYLWHWSVLCISRWTIGIHWWSVPFQIGLMLILAVLSYNFIETPFRKSLSNKNNASREIFVILCTLGIGFTSVLLIKSQSRKLYLGKFYPEVNIAKAIAKALPPSMDCKLKFKGIRTFCNYKDAGQQPTIWFAGDSHANRIAPAAYLLSKKLNVRTVNLGIAGTTFPSSSFKIDKFRGEDKSIIEERSRASNSYLDFIKENFKSGDIIVISLRYPYYFMPPLKKGSDNGSKYLSYYLNNGVMISQNEFLRDWSSELQSLGALARKQNVKIILEAPTPEFPDYFLKENNLSECKDEWFNYPHCPVRTEDSSISENWMNGRYARVKKELNKLAVENKNIFLFDTQKFLCRMGQCGYSLRGHRLYTDSNHLSHHAVINYYTPALQNLLVSKGMVTKYIK